ncbi:MAG: hypothetical protein KAS32_18325 [Candidatus Peribacteraceae bacterium]|nr:hypothetical protein [Candidatus Peribacteraceae bacterium]
MEYKVAVEIMEHFSKNHYDSTDEAWKAIKKVHNIDTSHINSDEKEENLSNELE